MSTVSPSVDAAREAARHTDGRFGVQRRAEADVDLSEPRLGPEQHAPARVYVMAADAFTERFAPAEYDFDLGWDGTENHPAFMEQNPLNPDRIHAGTWDDFVADVGEHGIREPVEVDAYSEECTEGHHRVVAALRTGQPVRFTIAPGPNGEAIDLTEEIETGRCTVEAQPSGDLVDPGPPPVATGTAPWERLASPYTGLVSYERSFAVPDGLATHIVNGLPPDEQVARDGEALVIGSGGITIEQRGRYPGQIHYKVLDAPLLDPTGSSTGRRAKAIFINWVEVERNKGKGWASAMHQAIREAHPDCIIPAAAVLEAPGRRLVKHYRGKHPHVHTGRFDTDCRIHPTDGPDDSAYRTGMLRGPTLPD